MKRLTGKSLAAMAAMALAVAATAAVVWLAATTEGSLWLLGSLTRLGGVSFSAQRVEGRILDRLLLSEVRVGLARQKLEIGRLELRWKPLLLLAGTVAVQELIIDRVRVQDDALPDGKPPTLAWPKVSESGRLFDGRIVRLHVTDLSYRRLLEQPLQVTSLSGSVSWQDGLLSISDLKAVSPSGQISGAVAAGFKQPSLTANLAIALAKPVAELDRFSLKAGQGKGPEPFVGILTVAGSAGTRKLLELSGELGLAKDAINLRRLLLTRPGQKGRITADGSLAFTGGEPLATLLVKAAGLDLAPELNLPTNLSGTVRFAGTPASYRGDLSLSNQAHGWQAATVSARYQGSGDGIRLAPLTGTVLDGSLAGNLDLKWRDGFTLLGELTGRNLNPARVDPAWKGIANFKATGKMAWTEKTAVRGSVSGTLLESRLHGQPLAGEVQAGFDGSNLSLAKLALQGRGFDLQASGELNQRISLSARVSDFSRLVPGAAGTLRSDGWLRWRDWQLSGGLVGTGSKLAYGGTRIAAADLNGQFDQGQGSPLHANVSLRDLLHDGYRLNTVTLAADGTLQSHTVNASLRSADAEVRLNLAAGYSAGLWKGTINSLAGRDNTGPWNLTAPAAFAVSSGKLSLSPLVLSAGAAERLELAADLVLNPLSGQLRAQWAGLNLGRANPYLKDGRITGNSHGTVRLGFLPGKRITLAGNGSGSGTYTGQGGSFTLRQSLVTFDGGEQGLRMGLELTASDGGSLKGRFSSTAPLRLALPENGAFTADLTGIDLALFKAWFPADSKLEGHLSGRAKGSMLSGQRFELDGTAALSGGTLHRQRPDGELNLSFKSATASWGWRGDRLTGALALTTAENGQVRSNFELPLPARFPVAVNPKGPLRATLVGQLKEKGIITTLFPGLIQESSGELDAQLVINGTWELPQVGGPLRLAKAGAYLPTAGIHLKDVQLAARLDKNLIRIDSFKALSGPGHIEGTAVITLSGWQVTGYQGTLRGDNFQTVYFPEIKLVSSPNLSFEGTLQKLKLRGELLLPELNIVGTQSRTVVTPSSDVIREGRVIPVAKSSPLVLDAQVRVLLGEKVFVKVAGIDAQLGGAINLSLNSLDRISSSGEIKVIKGRYRTYGVNLEIVRGRLFFAGGPIERPSLDFLALRTIGDIRAGVTVSGTLQRPITKLYSEPAMPDTDVLAYIVLGHPLGSSGEKTDLLTKAAGALLTSGQASVLQEQIRNYLGLSTLEIQGGVGGTSNAMGYKPLPVTPPGSIPAAQQPGITETVLTVGKYLTPQLYISYGKSIFTGNNIFRLRYDIFKQWQVETQTGGGESGADLYYKLEFK